MVQKFSTTSDSGYLRDVKNLNVLKQDILWCWLISYAAEEHKSENALLQGGMLKVIACLIWLLWQHQ